MLTVVGLALFAGAADMIAVTWPVFGLALIVAVPVGLVGLAFLSLAVTAVRSAFGAGVPRA